MKKIKQNKPIKEVKPPNEKPIALEMSFEEAMKRIIRVKPEEIKEQKSA